jgi:hypothetical protein
MAKVKQSLPAHINAALMKGTPLTEDGIYVESTMANIVRDLDTLLGICTRTDFGRDHIVEVTESAVAGYDHFFIAPKVLYYNKQVFFEMSRPTCSSDICPWGARILSPITISPRVLKGLGIAYLSRWWNFKAIELIVSRAVRDLFLSEGITGLEYEECWPIGGHDDGKGGEPPAYVARMRNGSYQCAQNIDVGKNYCKEHSIAIGPYPFGLWTPGEALSKDDFQMLTAIRASTKEVFRYQSLWVISRRVLELLLRNRVSGLKQATVFLKEPFRPLLTDDNPCEER